MKIHIINPNSTASMTDKIAAAARGIASPGTQIIATNPSGTPASIEGFADEAVSVPPLLDEIRNGTEAGADAFVVACFDDPGLNACREVTDRPVIGICEAAMMTASILAARFSVVTTLPRAIPIIEDLADHYGMGRRCRRVRSAEIPVLALEDEGDAAAQKVRAEVLKSVAEDGAEAVILGCAGMADLAAALTEEAGVPVIDGVIAATKMAEALAGLGLKTSKAGAYAFPRQK
ncbi:aspartate/glutamate racemase family protein [Acuticoccus sp. MNP-M23]|uniref:aspartate/glutamate racemase family protein n=1 Tax=Acuticoccus sp. MNP-M23 TaxID=3072793 RepID=UPI002814D699|nr:aspartate/glutamate racemase family protein [Acuticoccus sp. MNP-M23]WMS41086.1 aspartate/glutamate racemase family protein [Acuticoccus sp. MNP-M23]